MIHVWWIWLSLRRSYNFCGVAWRDLLRIRSRYVGISLSIRGFLLHFGLSIGVGNCISSSVKESSVSAQSVRSSCLCFCGSRFSLRSCHSPVYLVLLWGGFLCLNTHVFHIVLHYWRSVVFTNMSSEYLLLCSVVLFSQGLRLLPQCWVVLVCIVTVLFVP